MELRFEAQEGRVCGLKLEIWWQYLSLIFDFANQYRRIRNIYRQFKEERSIFRFSSFDKCYIEFPSRKFSKKTSNDFSEGGTFRFYLFLSAIVFHFFCSFSIRIQHNEECNDCFPFHIPKRQLSFKQ